MRIFSPSTTSRPVLHVTTVHQPLDTRIYYKEVRALAESGYDVRLATTVTAADSREGVHFIPLGSREGSRLRRFGRGIRALRAILAHRGAIVHIHDPELLLVAALPALFGSRIVYDVHEFYVERISGSEWIPKPLARIAAGIYDAIERAVLPHFAGVVVVSEAMVPRYSRFVPLERIALVRNFPNLANSELSAARSAPHPLDGRPYAVHTGGASRLRAFDDLVAAAERLRELGSDLAIVNLGDPSLSDYSADEREALLRRAEAAGVVMRGSVDYHEAQMWLANAEVAYLPLSDTENNRRGQPNKLFEYHLFGLPVVAADIGRVAEIVNDTASGTLVPIGDGRAHGDALEALHRDALRRNELAGASVLAAQRCSFAGEFERLQDLYARIAQHGKAR